jgi:hypothetical protein
LFRRLAPIMKPILPRSLRIRALHILQTAIKPHIEFEDISFSKDNIEDMPTLVALCQK